MLVCVPKSAATVANCSQTPFTVPSKSVSAFGVWRTDLLSFLTASGLQFFVMSDSPLKYSRASARKINCLDSLTLAGRTFNIRALPDCLHLETELGIALVAGLTVRRICLDDFVCHPRSIITPDGDFLLMHAAGPMHYAWAGSENVGNRMYQYRSSDRGETWTSAQIAWDVPYSMHAAILFVPSDSSTIYAFGTEPIPPFYNGGENAPIGYRLSNDDGRTWGDVVLIRPENDPGFGGMSAMRMCETLGGAWLVGSHCACWTHSEAGDHVVTLQYLLRSMDRGRSWRVLPKARPHGWQCPGTYRMDEARPILLPGGQVLLIARTPEGRLWQARSDDEGLNWSEFEPTPLSHLDSPPMIFTLADNKTLVAFFHNKSRPQGPITHPFAHESRMELWCALSMDGSLSWSEPRLVAINACEPAVMNGWGGTTPMFSYADLLVNGDQLELFVDHQMRQILHIRLKRSDLDTLPTRQELLSDLE